MTIPRCSPSRTSRRDTLWELGLDLTVSPGKVGFRGAEQHNRLKGRERFKIFGVIADTDKVLDARDVLHLEGRQVGVVTCGMYSRQTGRSLAIARMSVDAAREGTRLEVKGKAVRCGAGPWPIPSRSTTPRRRSERQPEQRRRPPDVAHVPPRGALMAPSRFVSRPAYCPLQQQPG